MGKICFSLKFPNENARGCFHTVGHTETEADIDCGFYGLLDGVHYDEYGKKTKKVPEIISYGKYLEKNLAFRAIIIFKEEITAQTKK